jgi:CBS domain-containing protein
MNAPVMTIPHDISLQEAAGLLSKTHVTGAPVVDAAGRCLGVLSSTDFVTWAKKGGQAAAAEQTVTTFIAPSGEMIDIELSPSDEIHRHMTARPVTVTPATPIGELAEKMVQADIHRVLVVVESDRPCGIVTSTDVLAAVAKAAR